MISEPLQKAFWGAGDSVSDFLGGISDTENLKKENEGLRSKIKELVGEKIRLQELKEENEFLREALNLGLEKEFKLKLGEIIGKDVSQDILIINKGSKDGITIGSPVVTPQKVLAGKVGDVYNDFSKVVLISKKENSFDAKIANSDIYGVVKGKGNSQLILEFIPKEKEIKKGDFVITSSLGGIFPKNLLVGQVKEIKKSDIEPFQKIGIEPAFEIGELKELFIVAEF